MRLVSCFYLCKSKSNREMVIGTQPSVVDISNVRIWHNKFGFGCAHEGDKHSSVWMWWWWQWEILAHNVCCACVDEYKNQYEGAVVVLSRDCFFLPLSRCRRILRTESNMAATAEPECNYRKKNYQQHSHQYTRDAIWMRSKSAAAAVCVRALLL